MILIIDDDLFTLTTLSQLLGFESYNVETAFSGAAALKLLSFKTPELIILDMQMPDMHGLDVLKAIRADEGTRSVPVIVYTGITSDDTYAKAIEAGAQEFLIKLHTDWAQFLQIINHHAKPSSATRRSA